MKIRSAGMFLSVIFATVAAALPPAQKFSVSETDDDVVIRIEDLDLLQRDHKKLDAEIRLGGISVVYKVDFAAPYQTPAVLIRKAQPTRCGRVTLTIHDGETEVLNQTLAAKATPPPPRQLRSIRSRGELAYIEPGKGLSQPPEIKQPLLKFLPRMVLRDARRAYKLADMALPVISDISFPLISANNNCSISRQTAHPDDPVRRSMYVPLKSNLFNNKGQLDIIAHYLAEVELDPAWLAGEGETQIVIPPDKIKIHMSDKTWPPGDPNGSLITGNSPGGLGQGVGTAAIDDDGNLYYCGSVGQYGVARFNIKKAEWEGPPIDVNAAMNEFLPKQDQLPPDWRGLRITFDSSQYIHASHGRMFIQPYRFSKYETGATLNGVFSFPIEHWYDARQFRDGMKFIAGSIPGAPNSLYTEWVKQQGASPRLGPGVFHNDTFSMASYASSPGGPWRIDLNPDGSTKSINLVTYDDVTKLSLESQRKYPEASYYVANWWDYGTLITNRDQLRYGITGEGDPYHNKEPNLDVTILYDPIAAMRLDPKRYAAFLNSQEGPSLAACYMGVPIPDKPGHILGVGEYGYYLADYDLTTAPKKFIRKTYLMRNTGQDAILPVKCGLGPYGRTWWSDGDKRYLVMAGYSGVSTMLYSIAGKPLERFEANMTHPVATRKLDDVIPGPFLRSLQPHHGIDGRLYYTGSNQVDRTGNPYSSGLESILPTNPHDAWRLSHMTRAGNTGLLRTRVYFEPDGRKRQQFLIVGGASQPGYIEKMNGQDVPQNQESKIFLYEMNEGEDIRDVLGFTLPSVDDGPSSLQGMVFSEDQRYLITWQNNCLLSFDLFEWRYVDGRRLDGLEIWRFSKPDYRFTIGPDGVIYLCAQEEKSPKATFLTLEVSEQGKLSLQPYAAIIADDPSQFGPLHECIIAFVADPSGDGSYDLALGPGFRSVGAIMWLIPDFLPRRGSRR